MMERLFVYGTLAPGRANAHMLADVPGKWQPATIRGFLCAAGWGAAAGYPGIQPDEQGEPVQGLVFSAPGLAAHWPRLDAFEGGDYRRVAVMATLNDGTQVQVQVYALAEGCSGSR